MSEECPQLSPLEAASFLYVTTFQKYAGDDGRLDNNEFAKLIKDQMCTMCDKAEKENPDKIKKFFETMDMNKDDHIDFNEFIATMAGFTCICYAMACSSEQQQQ